MESNNKLKFKKPNAYKTFMILSFTSDLLFSLIFTVNMIYQLNVAKLSPLQLVLVGTILELTIFLFEIPTGAVADTKSRKFSIIIGYLLIGAGFIIEGLFPFFFTIILSQLFWGIGYTFTSGATQAWITDEIGEKFAGKAFVKGAQAGRLGELIAIPVSIIIGLISVNIPIVLGGLFMILLAIFLFIVMEERHFTPTALGERMTWKSMFDIITTAGKQVKRSHVLILILLISVFYGLYSEGYDRLWTAHLIQDYQSFITSGSNAVISIGILRGTLIILSILSLEIVNKVVDLNKSRALAKVLIINTVIIILSIAYFAFTRNIYIAILCICVIGIARNTISPLLDTWFNSVITNPNIRATVFSLKSQTDAIGQIGGGPVIGLLGSLFSVRIALFLSAMLLSPVLLLYKRFYQVKETKNK